MHAEIMCPDRVKKQERGREAMVMKESCILARLERLRDKMQEKGLEAAFFQNEANVSYLSGFSGGESFLLVTARDRGEANLFLTDSRYQEQAEKECSAFQVILYQGSNALPEAIKSLCLANGCKTLGFDPHYISVERYEAFQASFGQEIQLQAASGLVEELRIVKDAEEQKLLALACAATDRVFQRMCEFIQADLTEREIEWQLLTLIHQEGCQESFRTIVVSGPNGSLPHGVATDRRVELGDFVTMDFGCLYQGYHADMTRTVCVGAPSAQQREIYDIVLQANLKAEAALRAGLTGKEVDAVARNYIADKGYGAYFGHGLGHGVGLEIHEQLNLNPHGDIPLPAGTFVTVEPGIYLPGQMGVRIEDTVLVTEEGIENQFTSSKELFCL